MKRYSAPERNFRTGYSGRRWNEGSAANHLEEDNDSWADRPPASPPPPHVPLNDNATQLQLWKNLCEEQSQQLSELRQMLETRGPEYSPRESSSGSGRDTGQVAQLRQANEALKDRLADMERRCKEEVQVLKEVVLEKEMAWEDERAELRRKLGAAATAEKELQAERAAYKRDLWQLHKDHRQVQLELTDCLKTNTKLSVENSTLQQQMHKGNPRGNLNLEKEIARLKLALKESAEKCVALTGESRRLTDELAKSKNSKDTPATKGPPQQQRQAPDDLESLRAKKEEVDRKLTWFLDDIDEEARKCHLAVRQKGMTLETTTESLTRLWDMVTRWSFKLCGRRVEVKLEPPAEQQAEESTAHETAQPNGTSTSSGYEGEGNPAKRPRTSDHW